MHQPPYRDALSGRYVLPWTYLHAIKDYTDMVAHLENCPAARAVVNFSPVLIEQIEDLARRVALYLAQAEPIPDPVLSLLADTPIPTDAQERLALLRACMQAHRKNLIERDPHFARLAKWAETLNDESTIAYASDQFLRDLAFRYHLAWLGETVRRDDARVARWLEFEGYSGAADRLDLLRLIGDLLAGLLARYKRLADEGRCELTVTPYSHPILPLLLDFQSAREAMPDAPLPEAGNYPGGEGRVTWHLREAVKVFSRVFGRMPVGCWPSEGAVSDQAVRAIGDAGFTWLASSEGLLRASLAKSKPGDETARHSYLLRDSEVLSVFRDERLSDLVGFTYSGWHGDDAVQHFINELDAAGKRAGDSGSRLIVIALDGENAWEHYPFNGYYFLSGLYEALSIHPRLRMVTMQELLHEQHPSVTQPLPIEHLCSGSWVYSSLSTWIGSPEKNRAWDLLCHAKQTFDDVVARQTLTAAELQLATEQLAACESSDWFWWFGDYNPAEAVRQFDQLYRHQLTRLYRALRVEPPAELDEVLSVGRGAPEGGGAMRRA